MPRALRRPSKKPLTRCDIIITTGGLGPTVDDPTREAIAMAVGVETEFRPELWEQIQARFQRFGRLPTENNNRQAYVPKGAIAVENPVGTAPAFIVEIGQQSIIALPGVPSEMEYLLEHAVLDYLKRRYHIHGIIKARVLHTAGVGESQIDDLIGDLERLSNPTVGLAAHSGQVDVRITVKAASEEEADRRIAEVENEAGAVWATMIYGTDQDTLEGVALQNLHRLHQTLIVVEYNVNGLAINRLTSAADRLGDPIRSVFVCGEVVTMLSNPQELLQRTAEVRRSEQVDIGLGLAVFPEKER